MFQRQNTDKSVTYAFINLSPWQDNNIFPKPSTFCIFPWGWSHYSPRSWTQDFHKKNERNHNSFTYRKFRIILEHFYFLCVSNLNQSLLNKIKSKKIILKNKRLCLKDLLQMFHLRWFVLCQSVVHIETIELDLFNSKWPVDKNPVERWNKINELDQKNCGSRKGLFEEKLAKRFNAWRRKKKVGKKIVNEFGWKILKKKLYSKNLFYLKKSY